MAVTNDFSTDKRVFKISGTLVNKGHRVQIYARQKKNSPNLPLYPFTVKRTSHFFKSGFLYYAEYNIRLIVALLFCKTDILWANDADTLPAMWLASVIRRKKLVFDSHEYFSEVPELADQPLKKKVWQMVENFIIPRIKYGITVSEGIRQIYAQKFGREFLLIRNVPHLQTEIPQDAVTPTPYIIYQGALNTGRGLELMIETMPLLPSHQLWIAGRGPLENELKTLAKRLNVEHQIRFLGHIPFHELPKYTQEATCGISLEEDLGLNYRFALPNKLFDYIQAGIPSVVSDLPEMAKLVDANGLGKVLKNRTPQDLSKIIYFFSSPEFDRNRWKQDIQKHREEFIWENEEKRLIAWFQPLTLPVR